MMRHAQGDQHRGYGGGSGALSAVDRPGRNSPQKHVWRARIVLLSSDGLGTMAIMRAVAKGKTVVWRWHAALYGGGGGGADPRQDPALAHRTAVRRNGRQGVIELTNCAAPHQATHWTAPAMARAESGSARPRCAGFRPGRVCSRIGCAPSSFPTTPNSPTSSRRWSGSISTRPPMRWCSALTRNRRSRRSTAPQPGLPMKKGAGRDQGPTTTSAMAPPPCSPPSTSSKARSSAAACNANGIRNSSAFSTPSSARWLADTAVHVVLDNYATHKHPRVKAWLRRHARFTFHFTLRPRAPKPMPSKAGLPSFTRQRLKRRALYLDRRAADRDQPFHRRRQRQTQAVRVDQICRRHPRRRRSWETSVRSHPLALFSYQAARNFRNIWHHYPERFDEFRSVLTNTWPGMDIERPVIDMVDGKPHLYMFCPEGRISREIFWSGSGFQVWCQMLTHLSQSQDASLFLIDDPGIYLHSDLLRQRLGLLRDLGPDVLIATHSTEIITEAETNDISF